MSENEQFWRKHLDAIDASGLTTKVYAEQNQLKAIELYKWRNHFRRQAERLRKQQSGFMRVNLESVQSRPAPLATSRPGIACTIILDGMRIELAKLPPTNWLRRLCLTAQGDQ